MNDLLTSLCGLRADRLRGHCPVPCGNRLRGWEMSRIRKPQEMGRRVSGPEPFTQESVEERMDSICGCAGRFNCDCVSVANRAFRELWGEHNERETAVRRGRERMGQ